MGGKKPGFLRKYVVATRKFAQKPGFLASEYVSPVLVE
jgi:hypothetical protein